MHAVNVDLDENYLFRGDFQNEPSVDDLMADFKPP